MFFARPVMDLASSAFGGWGRGLFRQVDGEGQQGKEQDHQRDGHQDKGGREAVILVLDGKLKDPDRLFRGVFRRRPMVGHPICFCLRIADLNKQDVIFIPRPWADW